MERMPTIKIVYVPHTLCSDSVQVSNTLSAAEAKKCRYRLHPKAFDLETD